MKGDWNPMDIITIIMNHNPNMNEYNRHIFNGYLLHGLIYLALLIVFILGMIILIKTALS